VENLKFCLSCLQRYFSNPILSDIENASRFTKLRNLDCLDMFHRVIFFLAALTRRLFRSILGADDALFGAVMGTRGATYSAAGAEGVRATGGLSSASGTPTVAISASELDFIQLRSIADRINKAVEQFARHFYHLGCLWHWFRLMSCAND